MEHVEHGDWKLCYYKSGDKKQVMLLFHGFGQTHKHMLPLVEKLNDSYTCYNFDLFFHGDSSGPEDEPLEIEVFHDMIDKFLKKEGIDEFSLTGFSLGAKYVIAIMMEHASKINYVCFLAPDGIKTNIWYNLATYPKFLRRFFRSMIRHPQRFYILERTARRLGLINKRLSRFLELQMNTPDQRSKIYKTWVGIRHIKFKSRKILNVINENKIPVKVIVGKKDYVIPTKPFRKFCDRAPTCKLEILDAGHYDLVDTASSMISKQITAS